MSKTEEPIHGSGADVPESEFTPETDQLSALTAENRQLRDQLLRTVADFDNYRRRMNSERENDINHAHARLLAELLPIIDDFRRSMDVEKTQRDSKNFHDGIELIYNKILKLLENKGVEQIESVGQPFDVDRHEALMHQPSDAEEGTVIGELEPGYTFKDRVLRFSKVIVSSGDPK